MMQPSFCLRIVGSTARMHAVEHAVEVDLDELVPAFQFHVGPAALRHIDAGAVDQEVDAAVLADDRLGGLVDVGLVADIERDRLGLAALFGDVGHHAVELFLAAAGDHHRPAVRSQEFRPGFADSSAAAGDPGHAFPIICHANCLRCFLKGVFANPAEIFRPFAPRGIFA
ncbi:hypothetical protein ACVJF2_003200 [Bradyrhizobium sp. USDA 4519]